MKTKIQARIKGKSSDNKQVLTEDKRSGKIVVVSHCILNVHLGNSRKIED